MVASNYITGTQVLGSKPVHGVLIKNTQSTAIEIVEVDSILSSPDAPQHPHRRRRLRHRASGTLEHLRCRKPRKQVLLEKGVDVQAKEMKVDQRTQMNKAEEEEFKELESLLASVIATAAFENASAVRECVCTCVRVLRCQRVAAQSPSTVPGVPGLQATVLQAARRTAGV